MELSNCSTENSGNEISIDGMNFIIITSVISPHILIANSLILAAMYKVQPRVASHFFILSLSASDILIAIMLPFITVVLVIPQEFTSTVCVLSTRLLLIAFGGCTLSSALLAIDRYISIMYPCQYKKTVTRGRALVMLTLSWIYVLMIIVFPVIVTDNKDDFRCCGLCDINDKTDVLFGIGIFFPVCFIVVYGYLAVCCLKQDHTDTTSSTTCQQEIQEIEENKSIQNSKGIQVIGTFLLLVSPFQTAILLDLDCTSHLVNYFAFLAASHGLFNPLLQLLNNKELKFALFQICHSKRGTDENRDIDRKPTTASGVTTNGIVLSENQNYGNTAVFQIMDPELHNNRFEDNNDRNHMSNKQSVGSGGSYIRNGQQLIVPSLVIEDIEG